MTAPKQSGERNEIQRGIFTTRDVAGIHTRIDAHVDRIGGEPMVTLTSTRHTIPPVGTPGPPPNRGGFCIPAEQFERLAEEIHRDSLRSGLPDKTLTRVEGDLAARVHAAESHLRKITTRKGSESDKALAKAMASLQSIREIYKLED